MITNLQDWKLFRGPLGVCRGREMRDGSWLLLDQNERPHNLNAVELTQNYVEFDPFHNDSGGSGNHPHPLPQTPLDPVPIPVLPITQETL